VLGRGRSLTYVKFNRGAVVGWAAGLCGGAAALAAVLALFTGRGWHVAVIVLVVIAGLALVLLIWTAFQPTSQWLREALRLRQQRRAPPPPLITDRWRYTLASFDVGTLSTLGQRLFSNHAYMQPIEKLPPTARVGAFVACTPLQGDEPTAEYLRSRLRECLSQPQLTGLISKLTDVDAKASWYSQPGNGRFNLEADLIGQEGNGRPLASVLLLVPEQGIRRYGQNQRGAELYLHVDLPIQDGVPVKRTIAKWHRWFIAALVVPGLLARFLESVGIIVSGDPSPRFALQIKARVGLTGLDEIVNFGDLAVLSPRKCSMQFEGWAVADPQGKSASSVTRRFLTELCESTGRTGYESVLAGLDTSPQHGASKPSRGPTLPPPSRLFPWLLEVQHPVRSTIGHWRYSYHRVS
jgi:hypothetical protein